MEDYKYIDISKLLHCGVYVLLRRGEVVYVGKSTKPLKRLVTHMRNRNREIEDRVGPTLNGKGINFDGIWFLPCMLGQLATLELYFIRKYLPKYNIQGRPPMPIPDDIKALLAQMVTITGLPPMEDRPKVYMRRLL